MGYFVEPCIVESKDPQDPIMKEVTGQVAGTGGRTASPSHHACTGPWPVVFFSGGHPISWTRKLRPQREQSQPLSSGL